MPQPLRHTLLLLFTLLLGACQSTPTALESPPAWIENPGKGAVGSATTHALGRHRQEELAIARARERLAARKGVSVENVVTIEQHGRNDQLTVEHESQSRQVLEQTGIKSEVRAIWHDKVRDVIWAWVYPLE